VISLHSVRAARAAFALLACVTLACSSCSRAAAQEGREERPPNIVLIFADDLGYADLGSYGAPQGITPRLDRLASEGVRFTSFYAAQAVCSASRAALLTGSYPNRVSISGALGPGARIGLHPDEITIAELVKARGYATAIFGKWHLGDAPEFLPTRHGFDEYYGLPYSNDMWPFHPERPEAFPPLPLIEGERTIATNPDQRKLTGDLTARAVRFIERHRDEPFFLYLAHPMPHVPLFAGERFAGSTGRGLYADVVREIDWSAGQIVDTLRGLGLDRRTLVVFTSDNGPWLSYGHHAGSSGPFREGKGTTFEGGVRVPAIAWWPGQVAAGRTVHTLATTMDVLPTIARLTGATLPAGRMIDGRDIWPLLAGDEPGELDERPFYYYWNRELQAVRSGRWKLHVPHAYRTLDGAPGRDGLPGKYASARIGRALFDLEADPGETTDVAEHHPDIVQRLDGLVSTARADLGDSATGMEGSGVRPAGTRTSAGNGHP
jgi:arylsulfatase A